MNQVGFVKLEVVLAVLIVSLPLHGGYYPIIFVHGHNRHASCVDGWKEWRDPNSAMMRILSEHYGGYTAGEPRDCNKNTELSPTGGETKKIYNFSFYNPDGSRGVIGSNGKYWPCSYTDAYKASYQNGQWAKHLADFIDKVLEATGAEKVNIVAHSMGGLVARAAIAYYGAGNKVDKLMTLGTPHHAYDIEEFTKAILTAYFGFHKRWQKRGELLEMGLNYWGPIYGGVHFEDEYGWEATWCDWLYFNDPQVKTVTIAGDRKAKIGKFFISANDGMVKVSQAHLDYARFKPTIYASHAADWGPFEYCLPTSGYVTEFIKRWMIDDSEAEQGAVCQHPDNPRDSLYPNPWYRWELRARPDIDDYQKALATSVVIFRRYGFTWKYHKSKGFGIYCCNKGNEPVLSIDPESFLPGPADYRYDIWTYDLNGKVSHREHAFHYEKINATEPAYVRVVFPNGKEKLRAGSVVWIKWYWGHYNVGGRQEFHPNEGDLTAYRREEV